MGIRTENKELNTEPIYLSEEGYAQYLAEIEEIKEKLKNNGRMKSEAYEGAVGDGWHDNFAFEESKREEFKIMTQLKEKVEGLSRIVIIKKEEKPSVVNIDDYVTVDMVFSGTRTDELMFKLVGSSAPNLEAEIKEISLNSPIGQTVYEKEVGYEGSYEVNGRTINIKIKDICNKLEDINVKKR